MICLSELVRVELKGNYGARRLFMLLCEKNE